MHTLISCCLCEVLEFGLDELVSLYGCFSAGEENQYFSETSWACSIIKYNVHPAYTTRIQLLRGQGKLGICSHTRAVVSTCTSQ